MISNSSDFRPLNKDLDIIYKFLRGDIETETFEKWFYASAHLEQLLGENIYTDILQKNFRDKDDLFSLSDALCAEVEKKVVNRCLCRALKDIDKKVVGHEEWLFTTSFDTRKWRTPWIRIDQCNDCGDYWLIASDVTYEDESYFQRLSLEDAAKVIDEGDWSKQKIDNPVFWPSPEWLKTEGYTSVEEWQEAKNDEEFSNVIQPWKEIVNNVSSIKERGQIACIHCKKILNKNDIRSLTDNVLGQDRTANCPTCGNSSIMSADNISEDIIELAHSMLYGK